MTNDSMARRGFLGSACGAMGLLAMAGQDAWAAGEGKATEASAELKAAREKLLAEMEANRGIGVPRADGEFLNLMAYATDAKKVLEVGTYRGYSGIWIALALEQTGGKLTTIEIDPQRVKESRANFETAKLADRITNLLGDAHEVAKTVEGPLDLVFLDAEKGGEVDYFDTIFPKLRPGGFILLHNAISSAKAMKPYFEMLAKRNDLVSVILSLSMKDGFSVTLKKK